MVSSPKWISNFNKVRRLSPSDRGLLFQSVLLLPVIHIALSVLGYARLLRIMERLVTLRHGSGSEGQSLQRAREIARIVSMAARHGLYKASCLRRSLVVWWFLRKAGIQSQICFGVRVFKSQLRAHAWVEYNGTVLDDAGNVHEQYLPLKGTLPATKVGL